MMQRFLWSVVHKINAGKNEARAAMLQIQSDVSLLKSISVSENGVTKRSYGHTQQHLKQYLAIGQEPGWCTLTQRSQYTQDA